VSVDPHADTAEFPKLVELTPPAPLSFSSQVRVDIAAMSDRGKVRFSNEDHFLVARTGRHLEVLASNLPPGEVPDKSVETVYGMVVADGMGGEEGGEVASRIAIRTLIELVLDQPDWIMRLDDELAEVTIRRARQRYREINAEIGRQSREHPALSRMGTTMTLAYSLAADLFVVHIGELAGLPTAAGATGAAHAGSHPRAAAAGLRGNHAGGGRRASVAARPDELPRPEGRRAAGGRAAVTVGRRGYPGPVFRRPDGDGR